MTIIENEHKQRVLIPSDDKWLLAVEEQELQEEERTYSKAIYIADVLTLEDCEQMYVEVEKPQLGDFESKRLHENDGAGEFAFE